MRVHPLKEDAIVSSMEKILTVKEMKGAIKFIIASLELDGYLLRVPLYKEYLELLEIIPKRLYDTSVRRAYKNLGWKF